MTLDAKLRWKKHIKEKRDELNIKFRKMYCLLWRNSELSVHNKLTLYKQVIRPDWSYGIQLWGCVSDSNIQVIQRYQTKVLKCIVNAPWYVRNSDLHCDLGIETITDIIGKFAKSHEKRLQDHINIEASRLLNVNITGWQAEETVWTSYTLEHKVIQWMYLSFNYCSILGQKEINR
jgi:hypothetical protein